MSRPLRLVSIGLLLSLISLIFDVAAVGARWVRLGNDEALVNILSICVGGIKVNVANSSNNYVPVTNPAPDEKLFFYRGFLDPNTEFLGDFPRNEILASQYLQLGYHPDARIQGLPPTTSEQSFPTEAEWYVTGDLTWQVPTVTGEEVGVIVQHFISGNDNFTLMFVGNYNVLNCTQSNVLNQPNKPNFVDTRVDAYEPGQSAAVYCEDKMAKVYGINGDGKGYFAFAVTQADIDKIGIPEENTLLASAPSAFGGDIRLYKLKDTGELQINAPGLPPESSKEYVFTWAGCT